MNVLSTHQLSSFELDRLILAWEEKPYTEADMQLEPRRATENAQVKVSLTERQGQKASSLPKCD